MSGVLYKFCSRLSDAIDEDEQTGGDGSGLKHKMDILRLKMEKVHLDRKVCQRN